MELLNFLLNCLNYLLKLTHFPNFNTNIIIINSKLTLFISFHCAFLLIRVPSAGDDVACISSYIATAGTAPSCSRNCIQLRQVLYTAAAGTVYCCSRYSIQQQQIQYTAVEITVVGIAYSCCRYSIQLQLVLYTYAVGTIYSSMIYNRLL